MEKPEGCVIWRDKDEIIFMDRNNWQKKFDTQEELEDFLSVIPESLIRLREIAEVGEYSVFLYGSKFSRGEKMQDYLGEKGILSTFTLTCPCGLYMDTLQACSCRPRSKREKWIEKNFVQYNEAYDLYLELPNLYPLSKWVDEPKERIEERIQRAKQNSDLILEFDSSSEELLKKVREKMLLSIKKVEQVKKVARTISLLDNEKSIKVYHVAEALQYIARF